MIAVSELKTKMCFKLVCHVCFTWSVWSANKIESTSGSLKVLFWNLEIFFHVTKE